MSAALHLHSVHGETVTPDQAKRHPERFESGIVPRFDEQDWIAGELAREGIDLAQLSYGLWSPRSANRGQLPRMRDAYRFWTVGQGSLGRELGKTWTLTSDEFSRQDEWGCVLYAGECIGLSAYRWIDTSLPFCMDDSYFSAWPADALDELMALGSNICIGSNINVAPAWRGRFGPFSVKELVLSLAVERFEASRADVMAGTMRNARGMGTLGKRLGARAIRENLLHPKYGDSIDLVVFEKQATRRTDEDDFGAALSQRIWNDTQREEIGDEERVG